MNERPPCQRTGTLSECARNHFNKVFSARNWTLLILASSLGCSDRVDEQKGPSGESNVSSDPVQCCAEARALLKSVLDMRPTPESPIRLSAGVKQLFVDDYLVAEVESVERELHQPKKYGAVIQPDQPWEDHSLQVRTGPSWNPQEKVWMLWYTDGAYATSQDGVHWEKPVLGLREHKGSKNNNLMLPVTRYEFKDPETGREILKMEGDGTSIDKAFYDAKEADPNRRYKGTATKGPATVRTSRGPGFYPAVSADGKQWTVLDAFIPSQDESHLFHDEDRGLYAATVKLGGPYGRSVYLSVSKDFEHWTDPRDCLVFHADKRDQELGAERVRMHARSKVLLKPSIDRPEEYQTDVYNLPVFSYQGIYIGMPTVFNHSGNTQHNSVGFNMVELTVSRNLVEWERVGNREKFIPLSPFEGEKNYDTGQLLAANQPIVKDNEIWFYYTGLRYRDRPQGYPDFPKRGAICLAKLRLDGFVSLDAGETEGYVVTKPLVLAGKTLHVNVEAPDGELRAEVLDPEGKTALPGYSLRDSVPVKGDGLDMELKWQTGTNLSALSGKSVRLRFALRKASLYAFWVN